MNQRLFLFSLVLTGSVEILCGQSPEPPKAQASIPAAPALRRRVMPLPGNPVNGPAKDAIDVSEGYGSAKWAMSSTEFEKLYPEAKLESSRQDDLVRNQTSYRVYRYADPENARSVLFHFTQDKLVSIEVLIAGQFPAETQQATIRRGASVDELLREMFTAKEDSGVQINGGARLPGQNIPGAVPPGVPPMPPDAKPAVLDIHVWLSNAKLAASIENDYAELMRAERRKMLERLIAPKLLPPR